MYSREDTIVYDERPRQSREWGIDRLGKGGSVGLWMKSRDDFCIMNEIGIESTFGAMKLRGTVMHHDHWHAHGVQVAALAVRSHKASGRTFRPSVRYSSAKQELGAT